MIRKSAIFCLLALIEAALLNVQAAQNAKPGGNWQLVENWAQLPAGEKFDGVSAVATDSKGNVHSFRRDGNNIWSVDASGKRFKIWGQDIAKWTHGIRVDKDGFIWATDGQGNTIMKWSPDASKQLLKLGKFGETGDNASKDLFNRPTDVAVAANGDFFVSDGYGNSRVVKFDKNGKFLKIIGGKKGSAPGEFDLPHSITIDGRGRVLVADRENKRVQIFDQEGKFLEQWTHLGSPYGLHISKDDVIYIADGVNGKIWIANAKDGKLLDTIESTNEIHWVSVDPAGNVYAASNRSRYLRKYVKRTKS